MATNISHDLGEQLYDASGGGRVDEVERLLARGAPVNWRDRLGWTSLHTACYSNHPDVVKILTQHDGIDVNVRTTSNNTPLHYACSSGYLKCVQVLMETGQCDLGAVNRDGLTPLGLAVREGTIKYLIMECNVDVNGAVTRDGLTPLGLAVRVGKLDTINYLIMECNVDVNGAVTRDGLTPLGLAVREGKLDTIKYLIMECNVDVNGAVTRDGLTPLGLAVREGELDIIKYLIMECKVDVNDALLIACTCGATNIVDFLLNDVGCDPNVKDDDGQTPLFLAANKEIILLLLQHGATAKDIYTNHRKAFGNVFSKDPLKNPVKMLVIGHGGEGKSTLIEAMEHEPTALSSLVNIFISPKEVDGVSKKTAGIIPRLFKSRVFGNVLVYDFAGQEIYYSSHAAIIKSAVDACPPIFTLVISLLNDDINTTHSVSYWLGIIANQCANMEGKAPLIVVSSHADLVEDESTIPERKDTILQAVQKFPMFELVEIIPIDCRFSNSSGMKVLRRSVGLTCDSIRSKLSVSLNCHMFLIYLLDKFSGKIAVSLKEVQQELAVDRLQPSKKHKDQIPFIPSTLPRLVEICSQLSDKGHILFLHDPASPEKSFVIIDSSTLLSRINGTIFAPDDFKQHCKLFSSTGIVPKSKLAACFPDIDIQLLIGFLCHLELAVVIDDKEILGLINHHLDESTASAEEVYLFCPALITLAAPPDVWEGSAKYQFGWVLSAVHSDQFLDARMLYVLLLRLALTLRLALNTVTSNPAIQRHCEFWKTGVCWSTPHGVKVVVEISDKKHALVLMQAQELSMDFLDLRSTVVSKVVEARKQFCRSTEVNELLLSPASLTYPLNISKTLTFNINLVAESIVNQHRYVVSTSGSHSLPVTNILHAEVYANLGENILQALCNENDPAHNEKLSDGLLSALSSCWSKNRELSDIVCSAVSRAVKSTHGMSGSLEHVLRAWRNRGDGTCRALRVILDPLSVFTGKNPLVLAGVSPTSFCEDKLPQQTDEPEPSPSLSTDGPTLTTNEERFEPPSLGTGLQELIDKYRVDTVQLDREIPDNQVPVIAAYFDSVELYSQAMGLSAADQTTVRTTLLQYDAQTAMTKCLSIWKRLYSFKATTFRALLELLLRLNRTGVAAQVCQYLAQNM